MILLVDQHLVWRSKTAINRWFAPSAQLWDVDKLGFTEPIGSPAARSLCCAHLSSKRAATRPRNSLPLPWERAGVRGGLSKTFASIPCLHMRAGPIAQAAAMFNARAGWRWRRPLTPALSPGRGSQYRATGSRRKRSACNTDFSLVDPNPLPNRGERDRFTPSRRTVGPTSASRLRHLAPTGRGRPKAG